ncbi:MULTISPECIES: sulfurtransferase TusA family protein [Shewanella]|uniref:Sulfurtransferase TusA family protein n=3 Tax=Shewanellaceae TaxID=267890 RepID=A0ABU4QHB7_9GAMM|nr:MULTISPECIES: sulfurtransferase TusA family protein [Shewanella]MCE9786973.1 sulfurtransferase TusA family protein [Shewanella chilikensis]OIN17585.1 hypothetical protein BFS86_04815 [Shewanella algae]MCE9790203.1 sulfurtransferase TusA family protein [Shewanella indica]MDX6017900.1 sulfurtransferase TusA family protein [Shewanella indica]NDO73248.1 sulfurtransferase TusA family protein [Shewanella sp. SE1]
MVLIDLTQSRCPEALVKAKMAMKRLLPGETLCLLLSDPGSRQDVPRFAKKQGYDCRIASDESAVLRLHVSVAQQGRSAESN